MFFDTASRICRTYYLSYLYYQEVCCAPETSRISYDYSLGFVCTLLNSIRTLWLICKYLHLLIVARNSSQITTVGLFEVAHFIVTLHQFLLKKDVVLL